MKSLKKKELDKKLFEEAIINKKSFLGICSGMQVLGSYSSEGNAEGLNFIPGEIIKFPVEKDIISPHVGWNKINFKKNNICFIEHLDTLRVRYLFLFLVQVKTQVIHLLPQIIILNFAQEFLRIIYMGFNFTQKKV